MTEPDFWKKFLIWRYSWKHLQSSPKSDTLIFGWLVGWLVGNAVFLEMTLRIFMIFCIKLGNYKGRKVAEPDIWKKFLIWRYSWKGLQISPKSDTLIFGWLVGNVVFNSPVRSMYSCCYRHWTRHCYRQWYRHWTLTFYTNKLFILCFIFSLVWKICSLVPTFLFLMSAAA